MPSAGFEPAIPGIEKPKTYALDHTATGIGEVMIITQNLYFGMVKVIELRVTCKVRVR